MQPQAIGPGGSVGVCASSQPGPVRTPFRVVMSPPSAGLEAFVVTQRVGRMAFASGVWTERSAFVAKRREKLTRSLVMERWPGGDVIRAISPPTWACPIRLRSRGKRDCHIRAFQVPTLMRVSALAVF